MKNEIKFANVLNGWSLCKIINTADKKSTNFVENKVCTLKIKVFKKLQNCSARLIL